MSDAKDYITKKQIPQLFECLMTGLMYHRPSDHIAYLQGCLENIKKQGVSGVRWDLFLESKRTKTPLPPLTPAKGSRPSSRADSLPDKQPVLPPIAPSGPSASTDTGLRLTRPLQCPVVLVIGGPGSGKRELCRRLADRYGFAAVCLGDLVRRKIRDEQSAKQLWRLAGAAVESGEAVPEELLLPTLLEALDSRPADCRGVFIEGFPRSVEQAEALANHIHEIDHALLLDFDESPLQERLLRRYERQGCVEDSPANIGKRLANFKSRTLPVCRFYDDARKLLLVPVEEDEDDRAVEKRACEMLDKYIKAVKPRPPSGPRPSSGARRSRPVSSTSSVSEIVGGGVSHVRELTSLPEPSSRPSDLPACPLVLVIGGPGSGRSSQLQQLTQRYDGFVHVNVGEEARKRQLSGDAWGALIDIATQGDLDDENVTVELVRELLTGVKDANCVLLEGFPINEQQLRQFYETIGQPDLIVLLDCEEVYMTRRLLSRGRDSDRLGDNLSAVAKRIEYFKENTLPVVRHFDDQGKLCIILGDRDSSEVFYDLTSLIDYVFFNALPDHVKREQENAAETIQAAFQSVLVRDEYANKMAAQGESQDNLTEEEAAARIQAGFRGYQTRKRMGKQ